MVFTHALKMAIEVSSLNFSVVWYGVRWLDVMFLMLVWGITDGPNPSLSMLLSLLPNGRNRLPGFRETSCFGNNIVA